MNKLLIRTLHGQETPRRPVWLMRQVGRYLPEYRALRKDYSFDDLVGDANLASRVTMLPLERFDLDAAIVFADLMSPAPALGITLSFDPGPVLEKPLRTADEIRSLREPKPEETAPHVMETLRRVKRELKGRVALIGFAGTPFSLAAYLVEGSASKDFPHFRALAASDPNLFGELLARLQHLLSGYLIQQINAGADVIQIFDPWAGLFSLAEWTRLARPHLLDLLEDVGRTGIPRILFFQGASHLLEAYLELPCEAISVDWRMDLAVLRKHIGDEKVLQGNLDPAVLLAGPDATRRATEDLLKQIPPRGHIVNLGHGILPETPLESVQALIDTVHAENNP